jgi:hypothetical protein
MKIHVLGNPGNPTSADNNRFDYFSYDCYRFCEAMKEMDFEVIHYGLPGSTVTCKHFDLPGGTEAWNVEANRLIGENKEPGDVIMCFYGKANLFATRGHEDCFIIEAHIGYSVSGVFAPYRIFPSYAQLHAYLGHSDKILVPTRFDRVIPNSIDLSEFEYLPSTQKDDYILMMGRIQKDKGIDIAIQATEEAGMKLVIAGNSTSLKHLGYNKTPKHVEMVGNADVKQRSRLLSKAKALIAPTVYLEPFGMMVVEALASGTPVITSNYGAFAETNINLVTGFRCNLLKDFVNALNIIDIIESSNCQIEAQKYDGSVIYPMYAEYINEVVAKDYYQGTSRSAFRIGKNIKGLRVVKSNSPFSNTIIQPDKVVEAKELKVPKELSEPQPTVIKHAEKVVKSSAHCFKSEILLPEEETSSKFSVIIPTMRKSLDTLKEMLVRYEKCPLVGEVLIINNGLYDKDGFPTEDYDGIDAHIGLCELEKIMIIHNGPNIYVNPAWNAGVKEAKYEYLLFANDDILIHDLDNLLEFMINHIETNEVIGIDIQKMNCPYALGELLPKEYLGWGSFFAMKKEHYVHIPEDIKIYCGDNIQWMANKPLVLEGAKGEAKQRSTIDTDLAHFQPIMENDWVLFTKWMEGTL